MGFFDGLYEFWTGTDPNKPLHSYVMRSQIGAIRDCIPKIKSKEIDVNGRNDTGNIPLIYCFNSSIDEIELQERYKIAILFLELGATPYLQTGKTKDTTLHRTIEEGHLEAVRFMLWYDPEYKEVRNGKNITVAELLEKKGMEEFKRITEETAIDARRVKRLFSDAEELKERLDFTTAIKHYNEAANIFKKQYEIEKTLPYQKHHECARHILLDFYKRKIFECYQKCEECYDKLLQTPDIKKARLEILRYLVNQATAFKLQEEAIKYAAKIAELTIERKNSAGRDSAAASEMIEDKRKIHSEVEKAKPTPSLEPDDESTPLIFSSEPILKPKDSDAFSDPNTDKLRKRLRTGQVT